MRATDATTYSEVKKAILRRYNINEETYRQRFRAARKAEGEAYTELATRLADLFKKWTADCSSIQDVAEKLVTEQLLNTMPQHLRISVSEKKPSTSREAGTLADDYVLARRRNWVQLPGQTTEPRNQEGMTGRDTRKCHSCGQEGHLARMCPKKTEKPQSSEAEPKEKNGKSKPDKKCYNCHQRGHIAVHCPNAFYCGDSVGIGRVEGREWSGCAEVRNVARGGVEAGSMGVCRDHRGCAEVWNVARGGMEVGSTEVCGEYSGCEEVRSMAGDGRERRMETRAADSGASVHRVGNVEGREVHDIVLDTGCARTMVHQALVPDEKRITGKAVILRCANSNTLLYPVADVELEVVGS